MLERTPQSDGGPPRDVITLSSIPEGAGNEEKSRMPADAQGYPASRAERPRPKEDETAAPASAGEDDAKGDDAKDDDDGAGFWQRLRRHKLAVGVSLVILIVAAIAGFVWYLHARHYEQTDDAFIDGRPVAISPEVTGNIVAVPVNDNQVVRAGALLAAIDPRNYRAAVAQAQAQIDQAAASIATYRAQLDAQKAQVEQAVEQVQEANAALSFSRDQNARAQDLVRKGAGTVQNAQQTSSDLRAKQAAYDAAVAARRAADRQLQVLSAQIETAQAQLAAARAQKAAADANLTRTQLHATVDGRVTRLTAAVGAAATPGQALMILVPTNLWVTANFKETQLAAMRPGQPVDIEIDAYGKSYPGHVDSIQAGSGTAFSLLPAENATGNYVKVVQRVPVKITFDKMPDVEIGPGMSVVPTVRVR